MACATTAPMRRDTLARLASDAFVLFASLLTATLTAHALGPAGKGFYASLTLLVTLFVVIFEAGIGDALVVLVGLGRTRIQEAARATMTATLGLAVLGTVLFLAVGALLLDPGRGADRLALTIGGVMVGIGVCYSTLVSFLLAAQRVVVVAAVAAIGSAVTAATMGLVAAFGELHIEGAVLASLCGAAIAMAATVFKVQAAGVGIRPGRAPGYLPGAFRLGVGFQIPSLLVIAAARLDLLLVFELEGAAAAGRYSVALSVGALVALIPTAVAFAAFPRVSTLGDAEGRAFSGRVVRAGMAGAVGTALALAAVTPVALPWAFGQSFGPAVGPALILLAGGTLFSGQLLLARLASARGAPQMLVASFTASFVVMIALDLALIPAHGETGAAVAALASSCAGLGVALALHRRAPAGARTSSA